jgi:hypothetical protein
MSPRIRGRRSESAVSWLAAIESRRIDGASDTRTPIVRRRTHRGRPSREREQKDDEPRGERLSRVNDSPAGGGRNERRFRTREPRTSAASARDLGPPSSPLSLPDIVISGMPWRSSDGLPSRTLAVVASLCASRTRSGALSNERFSEITRSPAGDRPCRSGSAISSLPMPVRSSASRLHVRRYVLAPVALRTGNAGSSPVPCVVPLHGAVDELAGHELRSPHRELPTSWTDFAFSIDRSPSPRGPRMRGPHPTTPRSKRQLVDNSPRDPPGERNKMSGAFDFGGPLHRSQDKRPG